MRLPQIFKLVLALLLLLPGAVPGEARLTSPDDTAAEPVRAEARRSAGGATGVFGAMGAAGTVGAGADTAAVARILVFTKTSGWRHSSIPFGIEAIRKLGEAHGFRPDFTEDAAAFREENLRRYRAIVFLNTTRNVLSGGQQTAFERYIQAGGGFVGVHSAADTEYEWPWYGKLVGAWFANHPNHPNVRSAAVDVVDRTHAATRALPERWERSDEWYSYRSFYPAINVLAMLDEESYDGGTNGAYHPIAWYHAYDGGRAFYTGLGHTDESFSEPLFLEHLLGGIRYAIGEGTPLDYSKAYAVERPEENRFVKTILVDDLDVPMELAIAPDGRIFFTELDGTLAVYDPLARRVSMVHQFEVNRPGGSGLIGVALDPGFARNGFIYLYYSPPAETDPFGFRLSRFTVTSENTVDPASEVVLLTVPVSRNSGSHHGGSLAWDPDGNLILSTGDSTSPFPSDGYAPLDERPGYEHVVLDAQRSAANTNDLKGKILRIRPQTDGTYTIPEGNLFPPSTPHTRPEIFGMGMRNPYRIAVNPRTGAVYWGDIGPDAGQDSDAGRGPRGYDEFNVAREAGFFGWPYFIGNNRPYGDWDFQTETAGTLFDSAAPVNESPNNTGLRELPPAKPPFIWYPYAPSEEFPELGEGGRSAMAGAFYQYDASQYRPEAFPAYYDGALFVFEWMRNFVLAIRVDDEDRYLSNEPFMASNGDFRRPIDLAFGPDGAMYLLEYGTVYGVDNEDARLVRIHYHAGNRAPTAQARIRDEAADSLAQARSWLTSDRRFHAQEIREVAGPAPLEVSFAGRAQDPDDNDELSYAWLFEGETVGSERPSARHTYTLPGVYRPVLRVMDGSGAIGTDTLVVRVGNTPPEVRIETAQNVSFVWPGQTFAYDVVVRDAEDGVVDPEAVLVEFVYEPSPGAARGASGALAAPSSAPSSATASAASTAASSASSAARSLGETLIAGSDCLACHTADVAAVGPSFRQIASRYGGRDDALAFLSEKILHGGAGNWGEVPMSAHPQLTPSEAEEMVRFILSLDDSTRGFYRIPPQGAIALTEHGDREPQGRYILRARYTDNGVPGAEPLTTEDAITLRPATVQTVYADEHTGFPRWGNRLSGGRHKAHILLRNVDLTGITGFEYGYDAWGMAGEIEVRIDSYAGQVIDRTPYELGRDTLAYARLDAPVDGLHDVYFIVRQPRPPNREVMTLKTIKFVGE